MVGLLVVYAGNDDANVAEVMSPKTPTFDGNLVFARWLIETFGLKLKGESEEKKFPSYKKDVVAALRKLMETSQYFISCDDDDTIKFVGYRKRPGGMSKIGWNEFKEDVQAIYERILYASYKSSLQIAVRELLELFFRNGLIDDSNMLGFFQCFGIPTPEDIGVQNWTGGLNSGEGGVCPALAFGAAEMQAGLFGSSAAGVGGAGQVHHQGVAQLGQA